MNGKWERTAAIVFSLLMCINLASPIAKAAEEEGDIQVIYEDQEYALEEEAISENLEMQTEEASTEYDDDIAVTEEALSEVTFQEETQTDEIPMPAEEETDDEIAYFDVQDEIPINEDYFPDEVFRSYVEEKFDTDQSKTLSEDERLAVSKISFPNISTFPALSLCRSLEGIQYFTELEYLDCYGNELSGSLDLSGFSKLTYLDCSSNYNYDTGKMIECLNLNGDTALQELYCYNNNLQELSGFSSSLTVLNCELNSLTDLDVSGCTNLITLYCGANALKTLNVSGLSKLNWLSCYNGDLEKLVLGGNDSLTVLQCDWNNLTELDLSACPNLKTLTTEGYQLNGLDVSGLKDLQTLLCSSNYLGSLDLSNNPELYHLECKETGLTELDLTNNPEIVNLNCCGNSLTELDLDNQEIIRTINLSEQKLYVTAFASDDALVVSLEGLVKPENITNVTPTDPDVSLEGNYLIIPDITEDEVVYNYATKFGNMDVHLYIENKEKIDISSCTVMLSPKSFVYDGDEHLPEITVTDGERILTEGVDYTVEYPDEMDNTNVGDVDFKIIGKGFYTGEKWCSFSITAAAETNQESETENKSGTETEPQTREGSGGTENTTEAETETKDSSALTAEAVKTGDTNPVVSLAFLFLAAGTCFVLLVLQRRKHNQEM